MKVQIQRLHPAADVPQYHSQGAAAFDLHACLPLTTMTLAPGETAQVPTGIAIWLNDPKWALCLWQRSGLGRQGMSLGAGLIDSDYQGQIFVMLRNGTDKPFVITHGDRIAQAVVTAIAQVEFEEVSFFESATGRATAAFGSTGA